MVRIGAVRAGRDDDEGGFRMPLGHNRFRDIGRDIRLGATGPKELVDPGVHPIDRHACFAENVDPRQGLLAIRSERITAVASTGVSPKIAASGIRCSAGHGVRHSRGDPPPPSDSATRA